MAINIGSISVENPVFLAPMSGVSDLPFRRLVRRFGAGLVFSEMVASRPAVEEFRRNPRQGRGYTDEFPVAVQIAGCDPDLVAEAARIHQDRGAAIIDLNFGCPVKKVVNNFAGSALMRDERLSFQIMEKAVRAVGVPVTMKMRLGWDSASINAPAFARMAEQAGIRMITVHGRTRQQLYNGSADWRAVATVKAQTALPVIVNGDITDCASARAALADSGADGVMIGRGSYGRPWIVRQVMDQLEGRAFDPPKGHDLLELILRHYDDILAYYGTARGMGMARKHLGWYLAPLEGADLLRSRINLLKDPADVVAEIERYFADSPPRWLAA